MLKSAKVALSALVLGALVAAPAMAESFGLGRLATPEEIAAWDIDVRPDGTGLPDGSGTVAAGAELFAEKCAVCHGEDGKGGPYASGPFGAGLVGPYDPTAPWPPSPKTIGSFWPYATTLYDYIHRAQPYDAPGSLTADEVYALVAWLLYQNELIAEDAIIDAETLPQVQMPAKARFIPWDVRDSYPFQ
jgi:cytochrome c